MTFYVGIDPGQTGGIAFVGPDGDLRDVVPMPTHDSEVSGWMVAQILEVYRKEAGRLVVVIEQVNSMPGQGVASTFKFGKNFGIVLGAVQAMALPLERVRPQVWKKMFTLIGKDKDASRGKATELWPHMAEHWRRKADTGVSDAALIAEAARRMNL